MSVRYIAGIAVGTEISLEDAKAIDFDNVIYSNWQPNDKLIFGEWLVKVDDYDGDTYIPLDDICFTQNDVNKIRAAWEKCFPERSQPILKKFFVYLID